MLWEPARVWRDKAGGIQYGGGEIIPVNAAIDSVNPSRVCILASRSTTPSTAGLPPRQNHILRPKGIGGEGGIKASGIGNIAVDHRFFAGVGFQAFQKNFGNSLYLGVIQPGQIFKIHGGTAVKSFAGEQVGKSVGLKAGLG